MNLLITGGLGFIGSHLSELALERGHSVRILDNISSGKLHNIEKIRDRVQLIEGSILDSHTLEDAMDGIDSVVHLAAIASVKYSIEFPLDAHNVNAVGTLCVLEAMRAKGIKRIVFASSAAVYGDSHDLPITETSALKPKSGYAADKLYGEHCLNVYRQTYGFETTALRFFNVFGSRQDPHSPYSGVMSLFANKIVQGESCLIFGTGEQTRDFVHVRDLGKVILDVVKSSPTYPVMNVGTGQQTSLLEVIDQMEMLSGNKVRKMYLEERTGDVRHSCADVSKLADSIGWVPSPNLEVGLKDLLQWLAPSYRPML